MSLVCHIMHIVHCELLCHAVCIRWISCSSERCLLLKIVYLVSVTVAFHAVCNSNLMQSPLCRNIVLICLRYHVNVDSFTQLRSRDVCNSVWSKVDDDIFATVNMLLELISVRCGYFNFTHNDMTSHDAQTMIDWISTM